MFVQMVFAVCIFLVVECHINQPQFVWLFIFGIF